MKNIKEIIILLVIILFLVGAAFIVKISLQKIFDSIDQVEEEQVVLGQEENLDFEKILKEWKAEAFVVFEKLPYVIDYDKYPLVLDYYAFEDNNLVMDYVVTDGDASLSLENYLDFKHFSDWAGDCANQESRLLINNGISFIYSFYDENFDLIEQKIVNTCN